MSLLVVELLLVFVELALFSQPSLEIPHLRVQLLALRNVSFIADIYEPLDHSSQLLLHVLNQTTHEPESDRHLLPVHFFEDFGCLDLIQLIASEGYSAVAVGFWFGLKLREGHGSEDSNIRCADKLKRYSTHVPPHGGKAFAEKVWCQILEKGNGPEDGVGHSLWVLLFCLDCLHEMDLDIVLGGEMGDIGGVIDRVIQSLPKLSVI